MDPYSAIFGSTAPQLTPLSLSNVNSSVQPQVPNASTTAIGNAAAPQPPVDMAPQAAGGMPMAISMPSAPDATTVANANSTINTANAASAKTTAAEAGIVQSQMAQAGQDLKNAQAKEGSLMSSNTAISQQQGPSLIQPTYQAIFGQS